MEYQLLQSLCVSNSVIQLSFTLHCSKKRDIGTRRCGLPQGGLMSTENVCHYEIFILKIYKIKAFQHYIAICWNSLMQLEKVAFQYAFAKKRMAIQILKSLHQSSLSIPSIANSRSAFAIHTHVKTLVPHSHQEQSITEDLASGATLGSVSV